MRSSMAMMRHRVAGGHRLPVPPELDMSQRAAMERWRETVPVLLAAAALRWRERYRKPRAAIPQRAITSLLLAERARQARLARDEDLFFRAAAPSALLLRRMSAVCARL